MIWPSGKKHVRRRMSRTIGLNVRGCPEPEIYLVCEDVYRIIEKMLGANKANGPFSRRAQFDFEEVRFILDLLGAPERCATDDDYSAVNLWISEG